MIYGLTWTFMQELGGKSAPKIFFHFGEKLYFGIFDFLELKFTRWFFTRLHFWPRFGDLWWSTLVSLDRVVIKLELLYWQNCSTSSCWPFIGLFPILSMGKKKILPKGDSNPQPPGYESIALTTLPWWSHIWFYDKNSIKRLLIIRHSYMIP